MVTGPYEDGECKLIPGTFRPDTTKDKQLHTGQISGYRCQVVSNMGPRKKAAAKLFSQLTVVAHHSSAQ
eukprot:3633827-Pleurochrysis_carterae.AAC.3